MKILLVLGVIVAVGLFAWQLALFIRDIIRHNKEKKSKITKVVDENTSVIDADRKE